MYFFKKTIIFIAIICIFFACNTSQSNKQNESLLQKEFNYLQDFFHQKNFTLHKYYNKDGVKDSLVLKDVDWKSELAFFKSMDIPFKKISTYKKSQFKNLNKTNVYYLTKDSTNMVKKINVLYVNDTVEKIAFHYSEKKDLYTINYLVELDKNVGYLIEAQHNVQMMYNNQFRIECFFK
jgi:hypothetical protein